MKSNVTISLARQQFDLAIQELTSGNSQECLATLNFIRHKIKQFKLNCDIYTVLNETYMRGIKLINSSEEIHKPFPWIRATSYNVIREMSRQRKREQDQIIVNSPLLETYLDNTETEVSHDEGSVAKHWPAMKSALSTLKFQDQEVLRLYWVEGMSWRE